MPRPFLETLRELRQGVVLDELADGLHTVVEGVRSTGRAGKLVLTITVKPPVKVTGTLVLEDDVTVKVPKPATNGTLFFATPEGNLTRMHPDQRPLQLEPVATQEGQQSAKTAEGGEPA